MINWHILSASANKWVHAGVRVASDEKGKILSNNENNQNKWCPDCGCVESCLGMRGHCSASGWHGLHGYSGGSVAHDMRMRTHVRAGLCGIVGTYLRCHGLRCRSSSRHLVTADLTRALSASLLAVACAEYCVVCTCTNCDLWASMPRTTCQAVALELQLPYHTPRVQSECTCDRHK